jgi:hypothetical protein
VFECLHGKPTLGEDCQVTARAGLSFHRDNHGRSAVNISSLAKGALGEHRRHDTDGIRLEIEAPGCRSRRPYVYRANLAAGRARVGEPGNAGCDSGADCRVEPQLATAGEPRLAGPASPVAVVQPVRIEAR